MYMGLLAWVQLYKAVVQSSISYDLASIALSTLTDFAEKKNVSLLQWAKATCCFISKNARVCKINP